MHFKIRDVVIQDLYPFERVSLYYFNSISEANERLKFLEQDQLVDEVKIMGSGEIQQLKDACLKYPLLASAENCNSIVELEGVKSYKLYNSKTTKANRIIYSSTHDIEECFNSLIDVVGKFEFGILVYE